MPRSTKYYELIEQYRQIHKAGFYGNASAKRAEQVAECVTFPVLSIIDYGCGRCDMVYELAKKLSAQETFKYDPGVDSYSKMPHMKYDLLYCGDCLEHIPEDDIEDVLKELHSISEKAYLAICTRSAGKLLPNGENAHATVKDIEWWIEKVKREYGVARIVRKSLEGVQIVTWK